MRAALQRFMAGRSGVDQLNIALLILGMALSVIGSFSGLGIVYTLAYVPLLFGLYRMFSRNLAARQRENAWLLGLLRRLKDRTHRYFRCPKCRQMVRVPKGKGKISIRCPKCGENFVRNT
ncbi:MAG: hypothetical protein IKS29_08005 [Oscillospiraceae bacterium]|nr:hypothetical protein [Oscillospiraceae bacterium]